MSGDIEPQDEREAGILEMIRRLNQEEPGPYTTRLMDISQPEAAILTKTAEKSLSKIENGKRIPSDSKLWDLAEGLGAPYPTWKLLKKRTVEARDAFASARRKYPKVA